VFGKSAAAKEINSIGGKRGNNTLLVPTFYPKGASKLRKKKSFLLRGQDRKTQTGRLEVLLLERTWRVTK